ncbi:hypothetical protein E1J38_003945 [Seonamhaeicola sediminis]|uniref:PorT family protein n=1 Tax=Seonamhaeicola sediminis TaxID=2528206 RepID=A0A562YHD9_9FLAO|nr:hypothetical protein [Seonamhaeicola sediminis]TWO33936.1 hypothetical protein E1J38_003945 [Seonamhaeicola sediminis]
MSDKKHIDRLFQEGFKDFEATPSDTVWERIEANLIKKKKRRVIPIWWRYAGVAALLILLLTLGIVFKKDSNNNNPTEIVNEDIDTNSSNNKNLDIYKSNVNKVISNSNEDDLIIPEEKTKVSESPLNNIIPQSETTIAKTSTSKNLNESQIDKNLNVNKKQNNNIAANNKTETDSSNKLDGNFNNSVVSTKLEENKTNNDVNSEEKIIQNKTTHINSVDGKNLVAHNKRELSKKDNHQAIAENNNKENLTIEEALEEKNDILEDTEKRNRWAVVPNAAPVYFNTLGEGSSIDQQFNGNPKSGEFNMSYGISASYAFNDKIKIRSGINKVNLGYNTNNVVIFQTTGLSSSINNSLQNITPKNKSNDFASSENISIVSGENLNKSSIPESFDLTNSSINQSFGFIEVPLEIQYALLNNKLGVNVIGGFSSFFLNNNKIFSEAENGSRTFLGEANNLNKISYSANFGFGFSYKFSEKIDLNLEPMFKYQINTFNNTSGNFTPIIIGVYTGFAIKF